MKNINFTELKTDLDRCFNDVECSNETLITKRAKGKSIVMISLEEYYSINETLYLLGSRKNAERLFESIKQMKTIDLN